MIRLNQQYRPRDILGKKEFYSNKDSPTTPLVKKLVDINGNFSFNFVPIEKIDRIMKRNPF